MTARILSRSARYIRRPAQSLTTGRLPPRHMSSSTSSTTPLEDAIRAKLTAELAPSRLEINNDSHKHAHHAAMVGNTSPETHFRVAITSSAFASKGQAMRHRMVYGLLKEELARTGGIHALQLSTRTPEEAERLSKPS